MGLKDLKILFEKKNIIFLILVAWLIVGFTTLYFNLYVANTLLRYIIFYPLLIVCLVLFLYSFFLRGDVTKLHWKNLLKAAGMFAILVVIYIIIAIFLVVEMIQLFLSLMFVVSIFSLIFITALFAMQFCFEYGVKFDDQIYKTHPTINVPVRWGLFLFGSLLI